MIRGANDNIAATNLPTGIPADPKRALTLATRTRPNLASRRNIREIISLEGGAILGSSVAFGRHDLPDIGRRLFSEFEPST